MLEENFEDVRVKIIEKSKQRSEEIANELSSSIVLNGDGLDEEILKEANLYFHLQLLKHFLQFFHHAQKFLI